MARKGLKKEDILAKSFEMIQKYGYTNFSIRELAATLGIKPASLYSHIRGMGEIIEYSVNKASEMLYSDLKGAISGYNNCDDALKALFYAYKYFAFNNMNIYELIFLPKNIIEKYEIELRFNTFRPIISVIERLGYDAEMNCVKIKMIESMLHGYIMMHNSCHCDTDNTFDSMVDEFIIILGRLGGSNE